MKYSIRANRICDVTVIVRKDMVRLVEDALLIYFSKVNGSDVFSHSYDDIVNICRIPCTSFEDAERQVREALKKYLK